MAYIDFWKRWRDFSGKTTRREYWHAIMAHTVLSIFLIMIFICVFLSVFNLSPDGALRCFERVWMVFQLGSLLPFVSMSVRRYRDAGYIKRNVWKLLIPGLPVIALCLPSDDKTNHNNKLM